jgi:hypothetical protein
MPVKCARAFVASAALLVALSMTGCSTQAKKVDCDGTLKPINRAAPLAAPTASPKELKPSDGNPTDEK